MKELKKELIKARRARAKYFIAMRKRRIAMRYGKKNLPQIKMPESMKNIRSHKRKLMRRLRSKFRRQR